MCDVSARFFAAETAIRYVLAGSGGAEGTRTPDPLLAKQVLSRLSYGPLDASQYALRGTSTRTVPSSSSTQAPVSISAPGAVELILIGSSGSACLGFGR